MADLFAGIGGFHLAFEQAGGEVVFASENDRHARTTYEANFRSRTPGLFDTSQFAGDIRTVDTADVPDVDVVAGGFPCQPFSNAGLRRGFADARGTLFFDIARIIDAKQPGAFVLENVRGLTHKDQRHSFTRIQRILTRDLGYSFHWKVLRASDYGLPQARPRVYMVGFRDPSTEFSFPEPVPLEFTMSDLFGGKVDRVIGRTLMASWHRRPLSDPHCFDGYLVDGEPRYLSIEQMCRLQGFPDGFTFPVSEAQARKQLGNAVAVPVAAAVARSVVAALSSCG
ncbi:hypothetical protein BOH66_16345 [Microbacterium aurum]|uniref:Cytosine-specific methyltransferase n=1 Tax=Microbacterium aurum TaxID=36805 RepID=A0A1P8UBW3_9MICO|nr:DNA cytosine methyltransferase [Microbacterium aurum]APZ35626.1 hypothetical protein BOH66_16345 [Microbacterium aurum]MBM7826356.1 DNA (cytosine-5)-methyltransferase 1 [Microbacterium aurum]